MTILNDFKAFLVLNKVVDESQVAFNFDDYKFGSDKLIIRCTGGEYSDIARKTTLSIIVKNQDMKEAERLIFSAFDLLCPSKRYQKPMFLNGKMMLVTPVKPPFYKDKEKDGRHVFVFDLKVVHKK